MSPKSSNGKQKQAEVSSKSLSPQASKPLPSRKDITEAGLQAASSLPLQLGGKQFKRGPGKTPKTKNKTIHAPKPPALGLNGGKDINEVCWDITLGAANTEGDKDGEEALDKKTLRGRGIRMNNDGNGLAYYFEPIEAAKGEPTDAESSVTWEQFNARLSRLGYPLLPEESKSP